jgi:serine/threonine protein kinase
MRSRNLSDYQLPETVFEIDYTPYRCTEIVHTGRHSIVLRVVDERTQTPFALKVWRGHSPYAPTPEDISTLTRHLRKIDGFTWLEQTTILNHHQHSVLLDTYPTLNHAVLMPWFNQPTWCEFKFFYMNPQQPDKQNYFDQKKATAIDTLPFARAFVHMLAQMEERGCTHHDLSDSNILLNLEHNTVICVDIDDLSTNNRQSTTRAVCGTPGYQFHSNQDSVANDRFAGALLLCEMLCLRAMKHAGLYDFDGFFTPYELDTRSTDCLRYSTLFRALTELSPELCALFGRTWNAATPEEVPAFWEWALALDEMSEKQALQHVSPFRPYGGKIGANTSTPALIVFAVDMRSVAVGHDYASKTELSLLDQVLERLLERCLKERLFLPRYHVAIIAYGKTATNVLANLVPPEPIPISQKNAKTDYSHLGIWQITQIYDYFPNDDFSKLFPQILSSMTNPIDTSSTHMTTMFETVYDVLQQVIDSYKKCPPPLIYHITQGYNYDDGNPAGVVKKISSLTTLYGHVQVVTAHTGSNFCVMPEDPMQWWGVRNEQSFLPGKKALGLFLASISSRLIIRYHFEFGYTRSEIQAGSYLLFPAEAEELVQNAVTVAGVSRIDSSSARVTPVPRQIPLT